MPLNLEKIDALILCGGFGIRLKAVIGDKPKCMAEFNGKPFLDILCRNLERFGIKRIILCVGYKAKVIKKYYKNKTGIIFSQEKSPLGTGGAIKRAQRLIRSNPFLVLNGDSFCNVNLSDFLKFHINRKARATICLAKLNQDKNSKDFGAVILDGQKRILGFCEKKKNKAGLINAGIYLFDKKMLSLIPRDQIYSLELDLFPKTQKRFFGFSTNQPFIDIGTPGRFRKAKKVFTLWKL